MNFKMNQKNVGFLNRAQAEIGGTHEGHQM